MDGIYGWIRNLTGFFLFMSVIDNLLPNKKYGKYVRLFSGMILILLVLQPLTGSLRLEDKIAHYYESFVFRYQAEDLQSEILGIEKQRLTQMIAQYEHAVEQDVGQMAEDMGFSVRECSVTINGEEGTEQFGTVTGISLRISAEEPDGERGLSDSQPIAPVEPVVIGEPEESRQEMPQEEQENAPDQPQEAAEAYSRSRGQLDAEVGKLRRKIASYYSLEEVYVEIQIVEG